MTDRKFYRTVINLEILSEVPVNNASMDTISYQINEGSWSGKHSTFIQDQELTGKQAAQFLIHQGSDPEFFMLDEHGNDSPEY